MELNAYIIAGIAVVLFVIGFILSKIVGCGIKILKFVIFIIIIGLVVYYAGSLFIK